MSNTCLGIVAFDVVAAVVALTEDERAELVVAGTGDTRVGAAVVEDRRDETVAAVAEDVRTGAISRW